MMPVRQRCPKCHGIFLGSDCIGRECMMCQISGDATSPPPIQSSILDTITRDPSDNQAWSLNGRRVTINHQSDVVDDNNEIVCSFISNEDLKTFLKLLPIWQDPSSICPKDFGWVPHIPETWTHPFARLRNDVLKRRFIEWRFDSLQGATIPKYEETLLQSGTMVRIAMVSRFGDVGITDDITKEGPEIYRYVARVKMDGLYDYCRTLEELQAICNQTT